MPHDSSPDHSSAASDRGSMPKGAGGVRCPECGATAAADGRGSPITLTHAPGCSEEVITSPLLHVAAFWVEGDRGEEMADLLATFRMAGTRGAVVTFRPDVADAFDFRRTMDKLDLAEVNAHPKASR